MPPILYIATPFVSLIPIEADGLLSDFGFQFPFSETRNFSTARKSVRCCRRLHFSVVVVLHHVAALTQAMVSTKDSKHMLLIEQQEIQI